MWMSNSHTTAYYWSHAGQHFEIREEGDWWAAVPDEEWPADEAQREVVLTDFEEAVGDRRQEIVFIGVNMEEVGRVVCGFIPNACRCFHACLPATHV